MEQIKVSHLNKTYKIRDKSSNLADYMKNFFSREWKEIAALKEISVEKVLDVTSNTSISQFDLPI